MFPYLTRTDFDTAVTVVVGIILVLFFVWVTDKRGTKGWR